MFGRMVVTEGDITTLAVDAMSYGRFWVMADQAAAL